VVSLHRRPPFPCESGFILSCALPLLQSINRSEPAPHVAMQSASLGVSFPIAASIRGVHYRASFPGLTLTVRPRRFSRPRRLTPPRTLRVYFTPQPRPGFTFQGLSPAAKPNRLVGGPYPLDVLRLVPTAGLPRQHQIEPTRLQGLDPGSDPKPPTE
jgi:hypothetical protein